jgi:hypothetical protein
MSCGREQPENRENEVREKRSGESAKFQGFCYVGTNREQEEEKQRENAEAKGEVFDALEQESESKVVGGDDVENAKSNEQRSGNCTGHPNAAIEHRARSLVRET